MAQIKHLVYPEKCAGNVELAIAIRELQDIQIARSDAAPDQIGPQAAPTPDPERILPSAKYLCGLKIWHWAKLMTMNDQAEAEREDLRRRLDREGNDGPHVILLRKCLPYLYGEMVRRTGHEFDCDADAKLRDLIERIRAWIGEEK